jgi:hypothetical protein
MREKIFRQLSELTPQDWERLTNSAAGDMTGFPVYFRFVHGGLVQFWPKPDPKTLSSLAFGVAWK